MSATSEPHQIIWAAGAGAEQAPVCDPTSGSCITCGDQGIPMTVVRLDEATGLARCAADDGTGSDVDISLLAAVKQGDRVIVHAGVAIALAVA